MSDAHGDAHGAHDAGHGSNGFSLEQLVAPTLAAGSGAGIAYLALAPLTAAPIIFGGALGIGLYYGAKYLYNSMGSGSHDKEHGEAHAEPAHAGAHGGH